MAVFTSTELNDLAGRLAGEYSARFEAKPAGPEATFDDDVLTFSFARGLNPEEESLRRGFRATELRARREAFLEPACTQLIPTVERFARSPVAFHVGLFDPGPATTLLLFGFEGASRTEPDPERQELLSWSASVRAQARRLRQENVAAREAHVQIRSEFRAERAKLAAQFRDPDD
jgi:hypothetical protein